jgi:quercetin dioxygenase-like cupin family protein
MELVSGNILIRPMEFESAGKTVDGHAHNFDHTTYVVRGALRIEQLDADTGEVVRTADKKASDGQNWVLIRAGAVHRITALEDNSLGHCIYSHRNPQGDIVQVCEGWGEAYV